MSPVQEDSPANDQVLQNYQSAAELANNSLSFALNLVKAGASVMEICRLTDEQLITTAGKNFEKVRAGIAFPCCLSVNNVLCYNAPADVESDSTLKDGDLIKIELGAHVDGFPTLVGTSIIVGAKKEVPATGKAADLVHAANIVAKVALCLLQAGKSSTEIANILKRTTKELGVSFVEGMISHLVGRNTLAAGNKMIIVNPSEQQAKSVETCELKVHDIFVIDIALSAGDGKVRTASVRPTIFKRTGDSHTLRLKTSRAVVNEVTSKFGTMAFNVRQLDNAARARMALTECCQNGVTNVYEVLEEPKKELTARVMFTTVITSSGPLKLTDYQLKTDTIKSECSVMSKDILDLLTTPMSTKKATA